MSIINIFEQASRQQLRFDSPKGALTVEQLWTLPLTSKVGSANLNDIAVALYKQREASTISFVDDVKKSDTVTLLKFDIVKHIIDTIKAERDLATAAEKRASDKQAIMALIEKKRGEKLESKSEEELMALLKDM